MQALRLARCVRENEIHGMGYIGHWKYEFKLVYSIRSNSGQFDKSNDFILKGCKCTLDKNAKRCYNQKNCPAAHFGGAPNI